MAPMVIHPSQLLCCITLSLASVCVAAWATDRVHAVQSASGGAAGIQHGDRRALQATPPPGGSRPMGRVIAWGSDEEYAWKYAGQATVPEDLAVLTNVVSIAAGEAHSLAVLSTGEVRAWGSNLFGQCSVPPSLSDVISVAAGGNISVALRRDGTVIAWGDGSDRQTTVPPGLANVTQVAQGCYHTLGLLANGTVTAWGINGDNQATVPSGLVGVAEVACGCFHSLARLKNGSVVAWGAPNNNRTAVPSGLSKVQGVAGGFTFSLVINDGAVIGFGFNGDNQTSPIPAKAQSNVVKVAAGSYHSLALLNSGEVVGWGSPLQGQISIPPEALSNVLDISAGLRHSMAIAQVTANTPSPPPPAPAPPPAPVQPTGMALAWGSNQTEQLFYAGQVPVPAGIASLSNVVAVAAGEAHSVALLSTGEVLTWGDNFKHQIDVPTIVSNARVVSIAAGYNFTLALLGNGTVFGWGDDGIGQIAMPRGLTGVQQISAGCAYGLALLRNGSVVAWGDDSDGIVTNATGLSNVVEIAAGCSHALARLRNGTVVAWGHAADGRIAVPSDLTNATGIAGGRYHSLAINGAGAVVGWGFNGDGQTSVPKQALSDVVQVAAGGFHSLALLNTGQVVAWGSSLQGQTTVPLEATANVFSIAAGMRHSMALVGPASSPSPLPPSPSPAPVPAPVSPTSNTTPVPPSPSPASAPSPVPPSPGINTPPPPPLSTAMESPSPSNTAAIVGAAVGAVGGVLLLAALIVGVVWWRKKRTGPPLASTGDTELKPDGNGPPATAVQLSAAAAGPPVGKGSPPSTGTWPAPGTGDGFAAAAMGTVAGRDSSSYQPQPLPPPGYPSAYGATPASSSGPPGPWTPPPPLSLVSAGSREVHTPSTMLGRNAPLDVTRVIWDRRLSNLKIAWEDIAIDDDAVLGQGGFGTVWKGMWQGTIPVAVKSLRPEKLTPRALDELRREALIMCDMHHPSIAPVYGLVDDGTHHALVMKLYNRGSIAAAISRPAYCMLGLVERLQMAQQVASGMRILHERKPAPIIHGDLKTSNLLVDDDGKSVAIADFGLACCLREGQLGQVVESGALSIPISPPEVLESPVAPRTTAGDVYAFGILLMEITTGRPAFRGMHVQDVMRAVLMGGRPTIPAEVPADVAAIITACWAQDAAARPTFAEVVMRMSHALASAQQAGSANNTTTLADLTSNWA